MRIKPSQPQPTKSSSLDCSLFASCPVSMSPKSLKHRQRRRLVTTFTSIVLLIGLPKLSSAWSVDSSWKSEIKIQEQEKSISMLLNRHSFPSSHLFTRGTDTIQLLQPSSQDDNGRVLGFDIFSTQASSRSNVDLETWNHNRPGLVSFSGNSGLMWNANNNKLDYFQELPAWFPWLPTKAQIQSLKVTELKEACRQRGLVKIGNKADLQERLLEWTAEQQQQHQAARISGDFLTSWFEDETTIQKYAKGASNSTAGTPNSLAEWSRSVDLDHLREKRREIHRIKRQGRPLPTKKPAVPELPTKEYMMKLTKALQTPSSPYASNKKVKELYMASKKADQMGERKVAIQLLETLLEATPNDGRVYRRLSRMYNEQGDGHKARATLQMGIRRQPDNPWLWHGVAHLMGQTHRARQCYQKAIQLDPTFAHSYHALGTLEHNQGNIAQATKILKRGIEFCPTNHRLHHALGDLYRGAKLLEDAERSYRRSLEYGSPINYCFAYSALACVAYERENIDGTRKWLQRSVQLNNGRHAQGWMSLAQLEEAQGNIDEARSVCTTAIAQYERGLIETKQRYRKKTFDKNFKKQDFSVKRQELSLNHVDTKNLLLQSVPKYRSGDKFLNVYRNWARLEERYGSFEMVDQVYERASIAFPLAFKVTLDWASYHATMHNHDRARSLYIEACNKASGRNSEPFRIFADFEMSLGNYAQARKILFRGAQVSSKGSGVGLAELFHTWAICEWHLGNLPRAEVLFDNALRLTEAGEEGSVLRSFILYSIARLEFDRGENLLAQHCVGLCMKENALPGGKAQIWELWADIASAMKNPILERECLDHAVTATKQEQEQDDYSMFLTSLSGRSRNKGAGMQKLSIRRDPWQIKLFGVEGTPKSVSNFYANVDFPDKAEEESGALRSQYL